MHLSFSRLVCLAMVLLMFTLALAAGQPRLARAEPPIRELTIGLSAQGRLVEAIQIGDGPRKLVVVGDTHGGPEANTHVLTLELIDYFRDNPAQVPADVRLYLIPTANPDGLALDSRFDSFVVDLNRNMNTNLDACPENDWRPTVFGAYGIVSETGGTFPDSQIESRIVRNFLLDAAGAIFLHSNAGLVFPASCEHAPSIAMAQVYAEGAGYQYVRRWDRYLITGGMHDWAASLGIAAITPELISPVDSEFEQNLAGLLAVLDQYEVRELLPLPVDRVENGYPVPALLWRYWKAHGGEEVFGWPLEPAQQDTYGVVQTFSRARLVLRPDLADTPFLVQTEPLGREALLALEDERYTGTVNESEPIPYLAQLPPLWVETVFFEESGYGMGGAFLNYWRRNGGVDVFGYPLSDELQYYAADGSVRTVQFFENALLAYYPEDGSVQPEPLGWQALLAANVQEPTLRSQIR